MIGLMYVQELTVVKFVNSMQNGTGKFNSMCKDFLKEFYILFKNNGMAQIIIKLVFSIYKCVKLKSV